MRIAIDWKKLARNTVLLIVIGTFVSIINPYGAMNEMSPFIRWAYWTGLIIYGSLVGSLIAGLTLKWLEGKPGLLIWLVISSFTALLITPVISTIHFLIGDSSAFAEMPVLYVFVWVISAAMTGVGWLLHMVEEARNSRNGGEGLSGSEDTIRTFMSRLPLPYRNAELFAISSEDHYLRVHTSAGEHLFLERLSTAVHALNGARGLQTHRSWWVAEAGVEQTKSANGRIVLILKSGAEAPVSRTYAPAVKEAGWV